ncbi:MAG: PDZ domain-containing protein [Clostridiaceae bacterium]|jgi:serine protease Do|nr:PDZ domain-containing protein [Clostridiaceae bacterium]
MDDYNGNNDINRDRQENRWSYTSNYYPNQNSYTYQRYYDQNRYQDRYDDLKTSAFYNESYKKPAKGKLKGLIAPMLIVALISSLLTGGIVGAYFTYGLPETYSGAANPPGNTYVNDSIRQIEIIDKTTSAETVVAEKVSPSIVGISITYQYNDRFFGSTQNKGQGSGIIYSSDGYIITNNHVIENAMSGSGGNKIAPNAKIEVILPNQVDQPYEATVVGRDSKTDIAILKINVSELPAAEFGDSDEIKVGQKAIAIGNPAGLEFMGSVTSGIISGLNRRIEFDDGTVLKLIQTDAAINPGNSGGALLNSEGKVIGINTSKIGGAGYEGLGFAIPSNNAVEIAESLIKSGYVTGRPQIGIVVDTRFNSTIAKSNGVPEGILVYEVEPLSAAFMAGVKTGDIITQFNGVDIKSFAELEAEKNKFKAGDKVKLTVYRIPQKGEPSQGEYLTLDLVLGEDKG